MPSARKTLVSLDATPYYHCIGRCVRRAFLWGEDKHTGRDFSHRKLWVTERLSDLSKVFTINICAYAVMSNHYHLVLHIDRAVASQLSHREVAQRWEQLFSLPLLVQRYLQGTSTSAAETNRALEIVGELRRRLSDIYWYMRCLNERIARLANEEDQCTGRFWEGRFKSQAILDEAGLLACCVYVDLNPVRAGIAITPETSDFTSIQQRIYEFVEAQKLQVTSKDLKDEATIKPSNKQHTQKQQREWSPIKPASPNLPPLHPFANSSNADSAIGLPYTLHDYLELVDWTARIVRQDKKHAMSAATPAILSRLGFTKEDFEKHMQAKAMSKGTVVGKIEQFQVFAEKMKKRFVRGIAMPIAQMQTS